MNTIYILILFAHVGPMGNGNSNALASVPGFSNIQACTAAGKEAQKMALGTVKSIEFVCVKN